MANSAAVAGSRAGRFTAMPLIGSRAIAQPVQPLRLLVVAFARPLPTERCGRTPGSRQARAEHAFHARKRHLEQARVGRRRMSHELLAYRNREGSAPGAKGSSGGERVWPCRCFVVAPLPLVSRQSSSRSQALGATCLLRGPGHIRTSRFLDNPPACLQTVGSRSWAEVGGRLSSRSAILRWKRARI